MINFCKTNGARPDHHGRVPNVGLMAQKASEYGSHDKTFEMTAGRHHARGPGRRQRADAARGGDRRHLALPARPRTRRSATGSSWPSPARQSDTPAIFWLDPERAHDRELRKKVELYLKDHDLTGLDISIMGYNEGHSRQHGTT
ncbi:NADP-dependent isocitrate dehydrogenase [Pseudomonas aeruginosa]|nr:NADP-dependent isocitrate dehydrogenase [Pseudomonas aeruginosa]